MTDPSDYDGSGYPVWSVSSLKIPLFNIPDVDETFSIGALWRQCVRLFATLHTLVSNGFLLWDSSHFAAILSKTTDYGIFCNSVHTPPLPPDLTDLAIVRIISAHCSVSIWLPSTFTTFRRTLSEYLWEFRQLFTLFYHNFLPTIGDSQ